MNERVCPMICEKRCNRVWTHRCDIEDRGYGTILRSMIRIEWEDCLFLKMQKILNNICVYLVWVTDDDVRGRRERRIINGECRITWEGNVKM